MIRSVTLRQFLLLIAFSSIGLLRASAQTPRLLQVPQQADSRADQTSGVAIWRRQTARVAGVQRVAGPQEVRLPSLNPDRVPAVPAADPERRRLEKKQRMRELVETLQTRLREWEQFEAERQRRPAAADSRPGDADEKWQLTDTDTGLPDSRTNGDRADDVPQSEDENTAADSGPPKNQFDDAAGTRADDRSDTPALSTLNLPGDFLVEDAVDRVALADNLYAMGEYSLAKKMYEQADLQKLSPDQQFWVQFQNASCLRHMGDRKAAKKQLRILAGQEEAGWLARSSRWWLDMIDDRAELEQQLANTQGRLDSAGKKIDALTGR